MPIPFRRLLLAFIAPLMSATALAQVPVVELSAGMHRIEAELALDERGRMTGLMHRKQLAPQRGMLFAYPRESVHCMWMKNTFVPLSVAFLDREGRILNIAQMTPHSEQSHCSVAPAAYSLEMNQGWFAHRGLKPGAVVRGVAAVRAIN